MQSPLKQSQINSPRLHSPQDRLVKLQEENHMERNLRELNDIDKDSIEQRLLLKPTVERIQDSLLNRHDKKYDF